MSTEQHSSPGSIPAILIDGIDESLAAPSSSDSQQLLIASNWWELAALDVIETSDSIMHIQLMCTFLCTILEDSTLVVKSLSKRDVATLDMLVASLGSVSGHYHPEGKAKVIVGIFKRQKEMRTKKFVGFTDQTVLPYLKSRVKTRFLARELDQFVCKIFREMEYASWLTWALGRKDDIITRFLAEATFFRSKLQEWSQNDSDGTRKWKLKAVEDTLKLKDGHPLSIWIVASNVPATPEASLEFLFKPIQKPFFEQNDIIFILQKSHILATRYQTRIDTWHRDWQTLLLPNYDIYTLGDLALSIRREASINIHPVGLNYICEDTVLCLQANPCLEFKMRSLVIELSSHYPISMAVAMGLVTWAGDWQMLNWLDG